MIDFGDVTSVGMSGGFNGLYGDFLLALEYRVGSYAIQSSDSDSDSGVSQYVSDPTGLRAGKLISGDRLGRCILLSCTL